MNPKIPNTHRIALFGDGIGLPYLLGAVDRGSIVASVAAMDRPQYHQELKNLTDRHHLPLLIQPRKKTQEFDAYFEKLSLLRPTHLICFCYSMRIGSETLALVGQNAVNVHASLLPKNRGPNPVQWALIRGEKETGLTLHKMADEIDAGAILFQRRLPIEMADTWVSLMSKIDGVTPEFLKSGLNAYLQGQLDPVPQIESVATKNFRLTPEFPRIDFQSMTDLQIYNLIRAQVAPLAGAYITHQTVGLMRISERLELEEIAALRQRFA
jgi:methionyl-tRNA formyltransferase